jgi:uncharacterized membrane protein
MPLAPDAGAGRRWVLRRRCATRPRTLALACAAAALPALLAGAVLWRLGYPLPLLYGALQLLALALAFLAHARHATDHESVQLDGGMVDIELHDGVHTLHRRWPAAWVRVEQQGEVPVALCHRRERLLVGRHLLPAARAPLARELRLALGVHR